MVCMNGIGKIIHRKVKIIFSKVSITFTIEKLTVRRYSSFS